MLPNMLIFHVSGLGVRRSGGEVLLEVAHARMFSMGFGTSTESKNSWSFVQISVLTLVFSRCIGAVNSVAFTWSKKKPRAKPVTCPAHVEEYLNALAHEWRHWKTFPKSFSLLRIFFVSFIINAITSQFENQTWWHVVKCKCQNLAGENYLHHEYVHKQADYFNSKF